MNTIKRIFFGENIRQTLEGYSTSEIIRIMQQEAPSPETSEFAKVVGLYLSTTKSEDRNKGESTSYRKRKNRKLARRRQ